MESKTGAWTRPHGQTSSRWKVLTAAAGQPHTVPQIARRIGLSRQAVQKIANRLAAEGLAEFLDNPDHKTSPIVQPTAQGRRVEAAIAQDYMAWAQRFAKGLDADALALTARTLRTLRDRLGRDNSGALPAQERG